MGKLLHDVESGSPGSQKSVRADILGEHASRNIDAEQNIASFVFRFDPLFAGFRLSVSYDEPG